MREAWPERFPALEQEWLHVIEKRAARLIDQWKLDIEAIAAERSELVRSGKWVSGPADLMGILGRAGDELAHSDVLAWLLTPARRHGFGDGLLRHLAMLLWPNDPLPDGPIVVERERVDRLGIGTRADLLVWVSDALIVIENKVYAAESADQCELLFKSWVGAGSDVRFVLLSRSGAMPVTIKTRDAARAWRGLSHRQLADAVQDLVARHPPTDELAASSVRQYLGTLRRHIL